MIEQNLKAVDSVHWEEECSSAELSECCNQNGFVEQPLTFIDLFAGCGGLSLGLLSAGWEGVFAIEKNKDAFSTLRHNLIGKRRTKFRWPEWLPKQSMTTFDLIENFRDQLVGLRGEVDLIAGGPPCQGFSFAGRRRENDPRNSLKNEYVEIVDLVRPKYLLFENVKGFSAAFKNSNKQAHSEQVQNSLENLGWGGYRVFTQILKASSFGVPQPRARFILIAIRKDIWSSSKDIGPFSDIDSFCEEFKASKKLNSHIISVSEAISDLEVKRCGETDSKDTSGFREIAFKPGNSKTAFQKLMRKGLKKNAVPNSLRLAKHRPSTLSRFVDILENCPKGSSLPKEVREKYGMKKQCFTPLHPEQMSKTITTLPDDLLHYSEPRILTVRESARIQSFPDWFEFQGKYTTGGARRREECPRYTQVGNAVPPLMAEALGEKLIKLDQVLCDE